ncbi:SLBB domain-containing protein [Granulicella sp. WH15]|uniref:SLBB domain-containing protein n=1 Tax=Granulicella sp. WH15 TaxID=2602070 RepID=UPI0013A52D46|nr:SLBB domain-containing protein [Granulicella sp. WH15]
MKQRLLGTALLWIILLFSSPVIALATGFQGQGSPFSPLQQSADQSSSQATSAQQRSDQIDGSSVLDQNQPLLSSPVLTPQQQSADQTRLQDEEQTTQRTDRAATRNQSVPPVELSEFQRMVAASVGKVLPIYGANLFRNVPTTFAPVNRIPVTPDYVIGPGDELLIRIWGQVILDGHFTVDRSGAVYIPRVGTIQVSGIPISKLTDYLRAQVGRNFKNFDLNVNMGQLRSIDIFIVGEARRPGSYTVSSLSSLVNALFASGGPSPMGSMRNIQVRRGKETIATFDLYDLLLRGDKSKDVPLLSGDVVYIPPVGPMVALAGSIDNPALYELKSESNVKEVLALAGGLTTLARHKEVRLERVRRHDDSRSVMDINLDTSGLATELSDGDILEISPIIDRFKEVVTLRGNVADPRRFTWVPGMRVRDLIPDKEALLTRDYWQQRNQLGLPILESNPDVRRYAPDEPVAQVNGVGIGPARSAQSLSAPNARDSDGNIYGNNLSNPAQGHGASHDASRDASHDSNPDSSTSADSTADSAAANTSGTNGTRTSRNGNATSSSVLASQDNSASSSSGTSISSAVTATAQRFPIKNSVVLPAPEIDWAYAVIQRLNKKDLTTQLLPFNLGRAVIDGDQTQNLELEPGDVITVFSKADIRVPQSQQTKFVRLQGEFVASGIYSVTPGETLRQLVARAGGITKEAYLYGSQFTRESTKVVQQRRLLEYADDLDRRIKLVEANSANTTMNPQDQLADIAALQNSRTVAGRLRQLSANGRIVLNMTPDSSTLNDIPDLPLEDGDTFVIPQRPLSVDVYGAVYTQSSFLYDPHKRAQDYIRQAGGGTRTADTRRSYIFHANGSIVSRQFSSTALFASTFEAQHLHPGDAVVVPEQVDKRPLLRNLVDVATIVGQFGLGIAAINVLR